MNLSCFELGWRAEFCVVEVRKSWFVAITLDDSAGWVAVKPQIPQVTIYAKVGTQKKDSEMSFSFQLLQNKGGFWSSDN
jgi:hypothetical protein